MVGGVLHPDYVRMEKKPVGKISHPDRIRPPGYASLRRFRESKPHADYFLTINLAERGRGLEQAALTPAVIAQWEKIEAEQSWLVRTATVMPDHLHLLVRLGEIRSIEECVKLLKGRLSPEFRSSRLSWQDGFYDHELRPGDDVLAVFMYIYLNPYRAGLITETQIWPGYRCRPEDWEWFGPLTREAVPQPEWLR